MKNQIIKSLRDINTCSEAVIWAEKFDSDQIAWNKCERADWMLWIAGKLCGERGSKNHRKVVLAACACARTALKFVPAKEKSPLKAILLTESYGRGADISREDLRAAADAADAAAHAAYAAARAVAAADAADAAAHAAYAAADAADAADAVYAARAAYAAAYAADAAAYAADARAADAAERMKSLKKMAAIIRKIIPKVPQAGEDDA